jgi:predicted outer membrane protein
MRHFMPALLMLASAAGVAAAQDTTQAQNQNRDNMARQPYDTTLAAAHPQNDTTVLNKMHSSNQFEIQLAQLADRNASSAKVKQYAARLVRDHQNADKKVTDLANKLGIQLTAMDDMNRGDMMRRDPMQRDTANRGGQYPTPQRDTTGRQDPTQQPRDTTYGRNPMQDTTMKNQDWKAQGQGHDHAQLLQRLQTLRGPEFDAEFARAMVQGHRQMVTWLEQAQRQVKNNDVKSLVASTLPTVREHQQQAQQLLPAGATSSSNQ